MKKIDFSGRVAVVTGAGSGLGRTYALELAARGAAVVVNDLGVSPTGFHGDATPAQNVVAEIVSAGGRATASLDSVATRAGGEAIIATALDVYGRVDVLINNAGFVRNGEFGQITEADFDALVDVHLKGAFHVSQPAFRRMKERRYGRILLTCSSTAVFGADPDQVAYASAKAGLIGLAFGISNAGKLHGVNANVLLPTATTRLAGASSPEKVASIGPLAAKMGGALTPEFVTPLAVYLCSEHCQTTHQIYSAIGARYARALVSIGDGWVGPRERPATVEDISAHFAEIQSTDHLSELLDVRDEFSHAATQIDRELAKRSG
jgi:NAD(P)-dependent dehydrogenase (short-subunit alcohol dehydrogenase family)